MSFWKTKIGKILSYGIHEHNSGLGYIVNNIKLLEKDLLSEKPMFSKKEHKEMFESVRKGVEKSKKSIDYIYENIKKETYNER